MSSRVKNLIIMLVSLVAVIAVVAVMFAVLGAAPAQEPTTDTEEPIAKIPPIVVVDKADTAKIASFTVSNAKDTFDVVKREDGILSAKNYFHHAVDSTMIASLSESLMYMEAKSKTTMTESAASYGFDVPTAVVTVSYEDGTTDRFVFGKEAVGTKGYYCLFEENYAVGETTAAVTETTVATSETSAVTETTVADSPAAASETTITSTAATETTAAQTTESTTATTQLVTADVELKAGDELYIIASSTVSSFLIEEKDLIGKTLITAPSLKDGDESGNPMLLTMYLNGRCRTTPVRMITDVNSEYPTMTNNVSSYLIKEPFLRTVDSDSFYLEATTMLTLTASGVACPDPTADDLAAYGLEDPYSAATLTFGVVNTQKDDSGKRIMTWYNERKNTILLGDKDENGNYYAVVSYEFENDGETVEGIYNAIYVLSPSSVPWAEMTFFDLTDKKLFLKSIDALEALTVFDQGKETVFDVTQNGENTDKDKELTIIANDTVYGTADFRKIYQEMIKIHRTAEKDEGFEKSGEPKYRLRLDFNDGSEAYEFTFYEMSASRYLLVTADGEEVAVSVSEADEFFKQYRRYLAGEAVQTPY